MPEASNPEDDLLRILLPRTEEEGLSSDDDDTPPGKLRFCQRCTHVDSQLDQLLSPEDDALSNADISLKSLNDMKLSSCPSCKEVANYVLQEFDLRSDESHWELFNATVTLTPKRKDDRRYLWMKLDDSAESWSGVWRQWFPMQTLDDHIQGPDLHEDIGRSIKRDCIDISLAREWLRRCDREHEHCRLQRNPDPILPLILVDVERVCLHISMNPDDTYVALSYVWGDANVTKTTSHNLSEFMMPGSLSAPSVTIPNTVRDAMKLTSALEIRYLWVDCLCIVQDAEKIHRYLNAMGAIYANAYVSVIAADGKDANHGLKGIDKSQRRRNISQRRVRFPTHVFKMEEDLQDRCAELMAAPWTSRSWTFQEGFFSSRMLVFNGTMDWICPSAYRGEGGINRFRRSRDDKHPISSTLPYLCQASTSNYDLGRYADLVQAFNLCTLSYDSDVLKAFAGITTAFTPSTKSDRSIFYGIPLHELETGLSWSPAVGKRRERVEWYSRNDVELPSWSWTSWRGRLDLTYWRRISQGTVHICRTLSQASRQCAHCGKWIPLRARCCDGIGDNTVRSPAYLPLLRFRTQRVFLQLGLKRSPKKPQNYWLMFGKFWGRPIGEVVFDSLDLHNELLHSIRKATHDKWDNTWPVEFDGHESFAFIKIGTIANVLPLGAAYYSTACGNGHRSLYHSVLCIKRRGDIALRLGVGHVLSEAWDDENAVERPEEVEITLG